MRNALNSFICLIKAEPVMFQFVIQTGLAMLTDFGLHWTVNQMTSLLAFTGAILTFWTRTQVTSHVNNPLMNPALNPLDKKD